MAVFLVDYENVYFKEGLKGADYLNENDKLTIFYSNACPSIRRDEMNAIFNSGCEFWNEMTEWQYIEFCEMLSK
jgi:hypothetical protein